MLSKETVDEFKKMYKEHYGEDLNDFVATEAGNSNRNGAPTSRVVC